MSRSTLEIMASIVLSVYEENQLFPVLTERRLFIQPVLNRVFSVLPISCFSAKLAPLTLVHRPR